MTPLVLNSELSSIILTPLEVESVLKTLTVGKASGPNGLSNRILKELSFQLSTPFCSLFNQSLQTGYLPDFYKEANVCPVPKKSDLSIVSNHRPISLLNAEAKVFERLVFKYLFNHLRDNSLLSSLQSGFIPGDSTVNQLTFLYNTFCQALDSGKEVRAVFCDISKAFDRVWHVGLLHKLKAAGVTGKVLDWFKHYLSDRKQRVVLPGAVSDWVFIRAGVPQGSILESRVQNSLVTSSRKSLCFEILSGVCCVIYSYSASKMQRGKFNIICSSVFYFITLYNENLMAVTEILFRTA